MVVVMTVCYGWFAYAGVGAGEADVCVQVLHDVDGTVGFSAWGDDAGGEFSTFG